MKVELTLLREMAAVGMDAERSAQWRESEASGPPETPPDGFGSGNAVVSTSEDYEAAAMRTASANRRIVLQ